VDALALATLYFVRHAKAGSREDWTGDDRLRSLTKKGKKQAEELVAVLKKNPITAVYSSPFLRCVQTVEPVARARGLEVKQSAALAEGMGLKGAMQLISDDRLEHAVLCCHGDLSWELVEELVKYRVIKAGEGGYDKASTWVVDFDADGVPLKARYIPAP
jgi:phosphohistidine phosphatase SixA